MLKHIARGVVYKMKKPIENLISGQKCQYLMPSEAVICDFRTNENVWNLGNKFSPSVESWYGMLEKVGKSDCESTDVISPSALG